jgi:hypothetical protein
LDFGPVSLQESDIDDASLAVIECDYGYNRIDNTNNIGEEGLEFLNKCQLADSFMRGVAFKLGKIDKFGA